MTPPTREPEVIRYDFDHTVCDSAYGCCGGGGMEQCYSGDYVRYSDYLAIVAERDAAVRLIDDAAAHWLALNIGHPIQWEGAIDAAMAAACNEIRSLKSRLAACEKIVEAVAAIDPTIYNRRGDVIALSQAANVATETFRAAVAAETQTNTEDTDR